jgi:hypothetical protein
MGKSYRKDAKNDQWRRKKQEKQLKKWQKPQRRGDSPDKEKYSPFNDSQEYHESFV